MHIDSISVAIVLHEMQYSHIISTAFTFSCENLQLLVGCKQPLSHIHRICFSQYWASSSVWHLHTYSHTHTHTYPHMHIDVNAFIHTPINKHIQGMRVFLRHHQHWKTSSNRSTAMKRFMFRWTKSRVQRSLMCGSELMHDHSSKLY